MPTNGVTISLWVSKAFTSIYPSGLALARFPVWSVLP